MRKIDSLRATLFAAIPEFGNDYSRLPAWIDRGKVQGRQTESGSFTFAFRFNVLAVGVVTDLSLISFAILKWARTNQPELLQPDADSFTIDADILDDTTADVLIQIELTQNYVVTTDSAGGEMIEALEQSDSVLADAFGFASTDPTPDITAILLDGEQLVPKGW